MDLVHCIYCSASTNEALSSEELEVLLEESRKNNEALNVTGMLLYHAGSFFQVLEGERAVVEGIYDKITKDSRHADLIKLIVEPIEERAFAKWTMGYPRVSAADLATIPGLNDFFTKGGSFLELEEGRAKTLLAAFKEGQWRSSLE
ncbi:MAG: BLUF domain-containing protein [Chromatiales bacterium]|nr:BLUF domain-containing protein [Chromatiales bacterium]